MRLHLKKKKRREVCADKQKVRRQSDYLVHAPPNSDKVDIWNSGILICGTER